MKSLKTADEIMAIPGVLGVVTCNRGGELVAVQGEDTEVLGNVLIYFQQMADLIGETCGLDPLTEGHLVGQSLFAVCIPQGENTLGVLGNAKPKMQQIVTQLHT